LRTLDASSLTAEIQQQVATNTAAIKALQDAGFGDYMPSGAYVLGVNSVETFGDLADGTQVRLRGDVPAPDPGSYYGTNAEGERGCPPTSSCAGIIEGARSYEVYTADQLIDGSTA